MVFLGVPESIWPVAAVKSDEAMPFPLPEAEGRLSLLAEETIRRRAAGCDAVLLGCGLGRGRQTDALVRRLMDLPQPLAAGCRRHKRWRGIWENGSDGVAG